MVVVIAVSIFSVTIGVYLCSRKLSKIISYFSESVKHRKNEWYNKGPFCVISTGTNMYVPTSTVFECKKLRT